MKTLLIGMAAAGLVGVTTARAEQQSSTTDKSTATTSSPTQTQKPGDSSMSQTPSSSSQTSTSPTPSSGTSTTATPSSSGTSSTASASSSGTGTTASASSELSGTVKKVDKDKNSLKISSATGGEQELKLGKSATITRDGNQAALDQIKEGDQVRASFDASGSNVSKIEVTSKAKSDKDSSKVKSDSEKKY